MVGLNSAKALNGSSSRMGLITSGLFHFSSRIERRAIAPVTFSNEDSFVAQCNSNLASKRAKGTGGCVVFMIVSAFRLCFYGFVLLKYNKVRGGETIILFDDSFLYVTLITRTRRTYWYYRCR